MTVILDKQQLSGRTARKACPAALIETHSPVHPMQEEMDGAVPHVEPAPNFDLAPSPLEDDAILAHTARLWTYHPIDADEPEPAPETRTFAFDGKGARCVGARVRGKKHKHEGTNCDDWFTCKEVGGISLLAVSDGAGSKHFSRIGARVSCSAAIGFLEEGILALGEQTLKDTAGFACPTQDETFNAALTPVIALLHGAVRQAHEVVRAAYYCRRADASYRRALGRDLALADFSATLLLTIVIPIAATDEQLILSCQIGDGMIAALDTGGKYPAALRLLGQAGSGDFSGETEFLTSVGIVEADALKRRTMVCRSRSDLIMLMTDGVADDYYPNETELFRLYFDLLSNGILDAPYAWDGCVGREEVTLLRQLPRPVAYPWPNDKTVELPLHYTRRICTTCGVTLEDLWQNPKRLLLAAKETGIEMDLPQEERLAVWLDHYAERGSFDDRTLLLCLPGGTPHGQG